MKRHLCHRAAVAALLLPLVLLVAEQAGAVTLERGYDNRRRQSFVVEAEILILDRGDADPILVPYGTVPVTHLRLSLGEAPERAAPLHYGQTEWLTVFVLLTREGESYTPSFAFLVPGDRDVPNRWIPVNGLPCMTQGLFDHLPEELKPQEASCSLYLVKSHGTFHTKRDVDHLLEEGLKRPFPVRLRPLRGGRQIPHTLDLEAMSLEIDREGTMRLTFDDPGLAEDPRRSVYRFAITRHGRVYLTGQRKARPRRSRQRIEIGIGDPAWRFPLRRLETYRMHLWSMKGSYGLARPRRVIFHFTYRPTSDKSWRWRGQHPAPVR